MLDVFERAWHAAREAPAALERAFEEARRRFLVESIALAPDPDEIGGGHGATLLVAHQTTTQVEVIWIGNAQLLVMRREKVVGQTSPHTVGELVRRQGHDPRGQQHRYIVTQTIRPEGEPARYDRAAFDVARRDRIVVASDAPDDSPFAEDLAAHTESMLACIGERTFAAVACADVR
jgi:serine/threonine protein phosphatase PrpC